VTDGVGAVSNPPSCTRARSRAGATCFYGLWNQADLRGSHTHFKSVISLHVIKICLGPIQMFVWRGPIQIAENRRKSSRLRRPLDGSGRARGGQISSKSLNYREKCRLRRISEGQPDLWGSFNGRRTIKSSCTGQAAVLIMMQRSPALITHRREGSLRSLFKSVFYPPNAKLGSKC
jgi:hypothetical protein